MSSLVSMQMLLFAGEALAASSLIMALAWMAAARKTASQRHLVWVSAFGALIALPALAAAVPARIRLSLAALVIPVTQGFDASAASLPEPSGFSIDASMIAYALLALWLVGVAAFAVRGTITAFALHGLRKRSVAHRFGHLPIAGPRCELRLAPEDCGPMTWGIFRPVILLPERAESWPRARLEAVLLHELAHIRRHDALTQLLALAVCALYWPNPLVWLAAARLRREAETAADDAVLATGVKPSAYAGELLQIASEFRVQRLSLPLAMAAPSALEARVKSVLEPNKSRSGVTKMDVFKIACLGMMATTAIAFARPSLAQDAPQVQSTPLPPTAPNAPPAPPAAPPAPDSRVVRETDTPGSRVIRETDTYTANDPAHGDTYVIDTDDNGNHRHIVRHWSELTPAKRARIHAQVRAAMAKAKPEIERAMRQVEAMRPQIEDAMRQVEIARPQIEAAMAEAERSVDGVKKVEIERAMAKARLALAKVPNEAQIDAQVARAMAKAHVQMEAMRVHMHDHDGAVVAPEPPDAPDADDEAPAAPAAPPAPPAAPPAPQN